MAANTPIIPSVKSQEGLMAFYKECYRSGNRQWNLRERMLEIDKQYIREADLSVDHRRAVAANRSGDSSKFQNVTIPVVKPQVLAAVAYQSGIFLSDYPMFGVESAPQYINEAKMMQAVFEDQSVRGAWARELMLFFYDGFKYNLSAIECSWDKVITQSVETDISYTGGAQGKPVDIIWEGNKLKRWNLYNSYFDVRVSPFDIPTKGEFACHTEIMSRIALKNFLAGLEGKIISNVTMALESPYSPGVTGSGLGIESYYVPDINPKAILDGTNVTIDGPDWNQWAGLATSQNKIAYNNCYEVSTIYARIIPSDFNLLVPSKNTPQVWKMIVINHQVPVFIERQTNAHEKIPVFFGSPSEDGLDYQTPSFADDAIPFQQVASAMMNANMASRRRAISDRTLYDPSRVSEAHMNSSNPSAKIPVRPQAYGKPVGEAVYAFPYRDDQAGLIMQEITGILGLADKLQGQNAARQGQFVKGNKTDGQWDQTMSNATSKDQLTALLYEAQVFTPLKEVLKLNVLQYQGKSSIYSPNQKEIVDIDPLALRKAIINFKITDGLLPADKVISKDALKVGMQVIGSSPQLGAAYNLGPMFSYMMKTENVDFSPFEKSQQQILYEQASQQWQTLAQLAIQKGVPFTAPQPVPQQFGYDPSQQDPAKQVMQTPANPNSASQGQQPAAAPQIPQ